MSESIPWPHRVLQKVIPDFASIAASLTDLTKKQASNLIRWIEQCDITFRRIKELNCLSPILQTPDFSKPFICKQMRQTKT